MVTGCSNSSQKGLCEDIDDINASDYTENENYDELASILQEKYDNYCTNNNDACKKLKETIDIAKEEVKLEDCSLQSGDYKELCETNNELAISDKKIAVDYGYEELWAICNE